jgi:ABC-type glutathione transport system ATPase component
MSGPILVVERAGKRFRTAGHEVVALDDVSINVERGECHAIIGESGSGKSTLGGLILGLFPPSFGSVRFKGETLVGRRPLRLKRAIQLIQQNPLSALNPRRTVGQSIRLALDVHGIGERQGRSERVAELLREVGLPADYAGRSPRGLSGGERQRVAVARALACEPELIVLDEPTSALDVLVQARMLQLLMRTRREHGLTYLFITHDLAVVRGIADRVSVFQKGRLVEAGATEAIFAAPRDAYTRRLLSAIPVVTAEEARYRDRFRDATEAEDDVDNEEGGA